MSGVIVMENKLKWFEFFAKYISLAIAGIWSLSIGSDWTDNEIKLVSLDKKRYELEAMKLGKEGLYPRASTKLDIKKDNVPWGEKKNLCHVTGKYIIENIGDYPIRVEEVEFSVYEIYSVEEGDFLDKKIISYSLNPSLDKLTPILNEKISVDEIIATTNRLERVFGYAIKISNGALYTVVASAQGGVISPKNIKDFNLKFGSDDLTIYSGSHLICQKRSIELVK